VLTRFAPLLCAALIGLAPAFVQAKPRIDKAADLPRFTYKIDGKVDELVTEPAKFASFAAAVRKDTQSVLDGYDIPDRATLRQLEGELMQLDYLEGRYDSALARLDRIRELQDKPADKLMTGIQTRAMIEADRATHGHASETYRKDVGRAIDAALAKMPYEVVQNEVKEAKASAEIASEALALGYIRNAVQPIVDKAGSVSSDIAPTIINARYRLVATLPLKDTLIASYGGYLAAHKVDKPDIWAARNVALAPGKGYKDVNIGIWDSGVDLAQYQGRTVKDASGAPAVIAFDRYSKPATGELMPIPADLKARVPELKARLKGFSDLDSNIDSPEASELKQYLSTLKPDQYKSTIEEIELAGNWMHGTHVTGIATAGNPYARVVVGRIEFDWHLLPDPCPTKEQALLDAKNAQTYVDFFRSHDVRVVNMSWGGSVKGFEEALEQCNIGKTAEERKAIAREYFDIQKNSLVKAFASAPEILFVAAAGNANEDSTFAEAVPADIALPNVITVGAVDKAGDEASFTSYGPTVVVDANGYQVESTIPGGEHLAESGTSMAAPQVTNLAAKLFAVNPKLTPEQVIATIRATSEATPDGRRHLIDPKKAVAQAEAKAAS
jgi:hypothetical protein